MFAKHKVFITISFVLFISLYIDILCFGFDLSRIKRDTDCQEKFRCNSDGACIDKVQQCNGIVDCSDNSDEIYETCHATRCKSNSFRCFYGACINSNATCDGVIDCRDGSDELYNTCRGNVDNEYVTDGCKPPNILNGRFKISGFVYRRNGLISKDSFIIIRCNDNYTLSNFNDVIICNSNGLWSKDIPECLPITAAPITSKSCFVPELLNGKYIVNNRDYINGTLIKSYSTIKLYCEKNYRLDPPVKYVYCINGTLSIPIPHCHPKVCAPLISSELNINCYLNGVKINCSASEEVPENTMAIMSCKPHYKELDGQNTTHSICKDGVWDHPIKKCEPVCGTLVSKVVTLIINGVPAKFGDFPWHVAIYRQINAGNNDPKYICGGSIISVKTVLSAAHCFAKDKVRFPASQFLVGAGKYYSSYDAQNDIYAQLLQVEKVEIPDKYIGFERDYLADIAVITVKERFTISNLIKPVCVDWQNFNENTMVDSVGEIVGWGATNETKAVKSNELRKLTVPYITNDECFDRLPNQFQHFLRDDKFCAGYNNGSSVCVGDSGGGLVFKNLTDNKYYIRGILNLGPILREQDKICDNFQVGVYTAISKYIGDFLKPIKTFDTTVHDPSSNLFGSAYCKAPTIENGKYTINGQYYESGILLTSYTVIKIKCNNNYGPLPPIHKHFACINGKFNKPLPKCVLTCPPLIYSDLNIECSVNEIKTNCTNREEMVENTTALISSKSYFKEVIVSKVVCEHGAWDKSVFKSEVECGEVVAHAQPLIVNGFETKIGDFPWHVAIYSKNDNNPRPVYVCGGSIISINAVLSAAICVDISQETEFYVGAGKYYSSYDVQNDLYAQILKVKQIEIPKDFQGQQKLFLADIAILFVEKKFTITNVVRPVCIDWNNSLGNIKDGSLGITSGWGSTNDNKHMASEELRQLTIPYVNFNTCVAQVPRNFQKFLLTDKFCGGYSNGSSVCVGDSGNGLVFKNWKDNKYYIRGIQSIGPFTTDKSCDIFQIGVYTDVSQYIENFITPTIKKNTLIQ